MTDLSGIGSNLTFTNGVPPQAPYYYITAHLDLTDVKLPATQTQRLTYYFNKDNNLSYLDSTVSPNYHNFHMISSNAVIGDVVLYSNSDLVEGSGAPGNGVGYEVGGADLDETKLQPEVANPVVALWSGPTGYTKGQVNTDDINTGVICFYGHEGGHDPDVHDDDVDTYRYLALTLKPYVSPSPPGAPIESFDVEEEKIEILDENSLESSRALKRRLDEAAAAVKGGKVVQQHEVLNAFRSRKANRRSVRQVVDPSIASGKLFVVVKVYPKVA